MPNQYRDTCILCGQGAYGQALESALVNSNVRRWQREQFTVWRCSHCQSLHSRERVDLDCYYRGYPFRRRQLDGFARRTFASYLSKLFRAGMNSSSTVLDYGCSEGLLLQFLAEQGVRDTAGYDAYVEAFDDRAVLSAAYDVVIAQDVIEHVEDPLELLDSLVKCVQPGGLLALGTPRAEGIDLHQAAKFTHSLHQPFHLHIFSEQSLQTLCESRGLQTVAIHRRHILDTPFPFVNWTFLRAYLRQLDNTLDAGFDPVNLRKILTSPRLVFLGLLGYLFPGDSEMLLILRKPGACEKE